MFDAVLDDKDLQKRLDKVLKKMKPKGIEKWAKNGPTGAIVFSDIIRHFEQEQGPEGKWAPWSPAYAAKRGSGKILQNTGVLRQSLMPGSKISGTKFSGNEVIWFNRAETESGFPYAYAHDNDGERNTLPQRKFMWISNEALELLAESFLQFVNEE